MNVRFSNPNSYSGYSNNNKVTFKCNEGVIEKLTLLSSSGSTEDFNDLQLALKQMDLTDTKFQGAINNFSEYWKKVVIKFAPDKYKEGLKHICGIK